ncbi:uncharacterized protein B0P05DRAFT_561094 [Gilbertella persicaria]|uniref:uncharacterized protein n=1 Tax=Gilbertella persicaria TaxID=101096 RepID=UPI00221FC30A|nr:uncharacterized protein B0P05DRAFT_561094 [Gilbertella persicaria]KAI8054152.1 hypothetical protein B0P05DRAFT_561094 [Gilbertella persicaria]
MIILDSDDDDLPTESPRFFDELLTQKRPTPVVQIEDDDLVIVDRKGKRKATTPTALLDSQENLTPKEIKKRVTEERKRQRLEAAQEKKKTTALEKQRLKEKKQLEKERTALFEKENRVRNDRTKVLQEMLVDIHPDFLASKAGQLVERVLSAKEATIQDLTDHELLPNYTIGWRRQCRSEWDSDSQTFVPLVSSKIVKEPVILVYLDTLTLINHVQSNTLDAWIDRLERDRDYQIMLLIEGLDHYYKKKMLIKRRQFASQVLNTEPTQKRKKHNSLNQAIEEGPGREEIEESLNYLQWIRHVMLVTTKDEQDTATMILKIYSIPCCKKYSYVRLLLHPVLCVLILPYKH